MSDKKPQEPWAWGLSEREENIGTKLLQQADAVRHPENAARILHAAIAQIIKLQGTQTQATTSPMSDRKQKIMRAIDAGADNDQYNGNRLAYAADWIIKLQDALRLIVAEDHYDCPVHDFRTNPDYGLSDDPEDT